MLKRRTPLKSKKGFKKPTKPMFARPTKSAFKIGRRGKMNAKAIREGDKVIARLENLCCELRLSGCVGSFMLTRAHRKKRRDCDQAELAIYCIACIPCHNKVEAMSHQRMFDHVDAAIKRR